MPLRSRDEEKKKLVSFRIRVIGFSLVFHVLIGFTFSSLPDARWFTLRPLQLVLSFMMIFKQKFLQRDLKIVTRLPGYV